MIDYRRIQPQLYEAMHHLQGAIDDAGIEPGLLEIVKLRASQINGCSFCVSMHTNTARGAGQSDAKLHMVSAWRHARSFTPAERAALRWCEEITRQASGGPSEEAREELARHFDQAGIVALTWAVAAINAWNRVAVPLGRDGGPEIGDAS